MESNSVKKRNFEDKELDLLIDESVRQASKSWGLTEWENHLKTLEGELKETPISIASYGAIASTSSVFENTSEPCSEDLSNLIAVLISNLTTKQKEVIQKYFFEGVSHSEIARTMGISRQRVFTLKKHALRRLKYKATEVVGSFPIVRALSSKGQFERSKKGKAGKKC